MSYPSVSSIIGNTPLVQLQRMHGHPSNTLLAKLEGHNPAGSVKDRPALYMIMEAERAGMIKPGDSLIEATSGNTGIALAMVAATRGYRMTLVMPENLSMERRQSMQAFGAELVLTPQSIGMEGARDLAESMQKEGRGLILDQFSNPANPLAHYHGTGPEIWRDTRGSITHFVSCMGTTGTILKEQKPDISIVGIYPEEGSSIAGIRRWTEAYQPRFFKPEQISQIETISQGEAENMARRLGREEGISCGVSSGGACAVALRLAETLRDAVIVFIICDRGDRYLSTGLFA
jgi:S-sulfo-L-cysteine synthase (O-acetyl-L-serine-dependent)